MRHARRWGLAAFAFGAAFAFATLGGADLAGVGDALDARETPRVRVVNHGETTLSVSLRLLVDGEFTRAEGLTVPPGTREAPLRGVPSGAFTVRAEFFTVGVTRGATAEVQGRGTACGDGALVVVFEAEGSQQGGARVLASSLACE